MGVWVFVGPIGEMAMSMVRAANVWRWMTVFVVLFVTGCVVGVNITRPAPGVLMLGKTTYQKILATYGDPWLEGKVTINERILRTISYAYGSVGAASHDPNIGAGRGLNLWFEDDILVGHEFRSSFKVDHTDFDESRINEIEKDKSDKATIIAIFGHPTGHGRSVLSTLEVWFRRTRVGIIGHA